jgi:putative heme-binding domain-containing protein
VGIPQPPSWSKAYDRLTKSENADVRERADQVAIVLGDKRVFPRMRERLLDGGSDLERRRQALDILVRGRDAEAASTFQAVLKEPALRGAAIRALSALDDANTPAAILGEFTKLTDEEKRDAVSTLVARPAYALALLDAMAEDRVPRTDLHAYHVRQLLNLKDETLSRRIKDVWGEVRQSSQDKQAEIARYKARLTPQRLKTADASNGRRLYDKTCAACHTLFGEGGKVGPDLTGSNRADLDYLLENMLDPSAVLGKDYRMSVLVLADGRVVSGLVQKETDSALTVRTLNDTVVVPKSDIEERRLSDQSLMPDRQLDELKPEETRDLVAYLASSRQVALRGPRAPIDPGTGRVPNAIEGETMKVLSKTHGDARGQKMDPFTADRWSGTDHLWWTGARPGSRLELELPVAESGRYEIELVLTKARDYGIVQLSLDGQPLDKPIDLFNNPDVITTGVLTFAARDLTVGNHKLGVEIIGAHPEAVKAYMFGLDYVRLRKATQP